MKRTSASGGWSALQELAHLGRYQEVFSERLERILTEDEPDLGRYRADDDPGFGAWLALDLEALLLRFRDASDTLQAHVGALSSADLARRGRHPLFGSMSVREWLEFFLIHEGHHLYRIMVKARGA